MSFSQFDSPSPNPYSQPTQTWPANAQQPNGGSTTQFTLLGIFYLILAVLGVGLAILYAVGQLAQLSKGAVVPPPNANDAERMGFYIGYWGSTAAVIVSGLLQPLVAWAGVNLLRRKGIAMAKIGSIVLCIPCLTSCCLLGIPFGIWGVIALNSNSAKQLFD